jgi:hypothetical protein
LSSPKGSARQSASFLYRLLIHNRVEKQQVEPFLAFCELLNKKYKLQKAEGLLLYHPLLTEFKKMLPTSLPLEDTIQATVQQGILLYKKKGPFSFLALRPFHLFL